MEFECNMVSGHDTIQMALVLWGGEMNLDMGIDVLPLCTSGKVEEGGRLSL